MAPNVTSESTSFSEDLKNWRENSKPSEKTLEHRKFDFNLRSIVNDLLNVDYSTVVWRNVAVYLILHVFSVYGAFLVFTNCNIKTVLFAGLLYYFGTIGVTMGAHRLWSHRAMKANLPIRIILATGQTLAFQNDIYVWARDHRAHHKFCETNADPHNASNGFFFAHMGWLLTRKHPEVTEKGKTIDLSDVLEDPVVRFQRNFYLPLVILVAFTFPAITPWYFWQENMLTALMVAGFLRYCLSLHATWLVNSLAHWIGSKPYDKGIAPTQNSFVSMVTVGEGWHNFHHVFPQDYRSAELGGLLNFNLTTMIIDVCAKYGWIWDRRTVSPNKVFRRASRTGDVYQCFANTLAEEPQESWEGSQTPFENHSVASNMQL